MMTLNDLKALIPAAVLAGNGAIPFESVSTDTRTLSPGAWYFALRGEHFDGHDFASEAARCGATALVVESSVESCLPQLIVADTRLALGSAAAGWRAHFDLPMIAVTGSNGKTTVTQMIGGILAAAFGEKERLVTHGNLNNDVGVPLMLLRLSEKHRAAALELGMNHPGEIEYLAKLARPTVALVNNAQREHQEFLISVEATAVENGSVISSLPQGGIAVFPADDGCAGIWRMLAGKRPVLDFALEGPAAVTACFKPGPEGTEMSLLSPVGAIDISLPLVGRHNVRNALAAATAALSIGISAEAIRAGLEAFAPIAGRCVHLHASTGARVIDDTYNANPDSVRAAIDVLAQYPSPRVLVLGEMAEVGCKGPEFHHEVGSYAREQGIERLLAFGELCAAAVAAFNEDRRPSGFHFKTMEELVAAAKENAAPGASLLVKGSRLMRMERVVAGLTCLM